MIVCVCDRETEWVGGRGWICVLVCCVCVCVFEVMLICRETRAQWAERGHGLPLSQ